MISSLVTKINDLKKNRNAVILVHNYQLPEVQDIADFIGDSLDLSKKAAATDADVIVFCGVHFMAETAAILSPGKTVLLPDMKAGCPMADMVDEYAVIALKKKHPSAKVVSYVNTTAKVKAVSDVCCTSANAVAVVRSFGDAEIIFVPDRNLGRYVSEILGRKMILANGFCNVHTKILAAHIEKAKQKYPAAEVIAHPECNKDVSDMADKLLSTSAMCGYAKTSKSGEMIIATEVGILHRLIKENPEKKFYPALEAAECPNMKKTTLEKVFWSLEDMKNKVQVDQSVASKALSALENMLKFAGDTID